MARGEMSVFEWIAMSEALGADGLEMYDGWLPVDADSLAEVRQAIEATGQVMSLMCFSPDYTHPDPVFRASQLDRQKRAIDQTVALGGTHCRILSGQKRPDVSRAHGVRWVVECIRQALEYAAEKQVVLAMENHFKDGIWEYPEFAQKADVFLEIIEQIEPTPWFGVQFDPSNNVVAGDDPVAFLEQVKDRLVSMHASDRYLAPGVDIADLKRTDSTLGYPEGLEHGVTGEGLNDYDAIFMILKTVNYDGWISIEDGMNGMEEMQKSVEFLRSMVGQYFS